MKIKNFFMSDDFLNRDLSDEGRSSVSIGCTLQLNPKLSDGIKDDLTEGAISR